MSKPVSMYTDGSCWPNPGPGGWAWVLVRGDSEKRTCSGWKRETTNNRMELRAILMALRFLRTARIKKCTVWSDSQLCVKTLNEWAKSWEKNGWRRSNGPVKNLDLVRPTFKIYRELPQCKVKWLRGHDGNKWNEKADSLALEAREYCDSISSVWRESL